MNDSNSNDFATPKFSGMPAGPSSGVRSQNPPAVPQQSQPVPLMPKQQASTTSYGTFSHVNSSISPSAIPRPSSPVNFSGNPSVNSSGSTNGTIVPHPAPAVPAASIPTYSAPSASAYNPAPRVVPTAVYAPTGSAVSTPSVSVSASNTSSPSSFSASTSRPTPTPMPKPSMAQSAYAPNYNPNLSNSSEARAHSSAPSSVYTRDQMGTTPPVLMQTQKNTTAARKSPSVGGTVFIIFVILILLAAGGLWFVKPDLFSGLLSNFSFSNFSLSKIESSLGLGTSNQNANIEDRVANPNTAPAANSGSVFPTGVLNAGKQENTPSGNQLNQQNQNDSSAFAQPSSNTYSAADQAKITTYLNQNINELAGTSGYDVTDVTFDGPQRAIVTYSNGVNTYSAVVNTLIDSAGTVQITNFTVLTK